MKALNCCMGWMQMIELILDGTKIKTRKELHSCFARTLHFPDWYGANLDALFDCLTELREDVTVLCFHMELMEKNMGIYAKKMQQVLADAAAENSHLKIVQEAKQM